MKPASLDTIKHQAMALQRAGKAWHFHLLGPHCVFNDRGQFAFVLECPSEQFTLVNYSDQAEKGLGQELLLLRYGKTMLNKVVDSAYKPVGKIQTMLERATAWNASNTAWHHHMLFPDCIFNKRTPRYVLMLESNDTSEVIESVTEAEPRNDLKEIERLFYQK